MQTTDTYRAISEGSNQTLGPPDIGRSADHQHRNGEPKLSRSRKGKVVRYADYSVGLWSMSSKSWVESPRLETHLDWLLSQLEPRSETVRDLLSGSVTADFFCYSSGSAAEPPSLSRAIRDRTESLGITIVIDHYRESGQDSS